MQILVIATCPFPASRGSPLLIERTTLYFRHSDTGEELALHGPGIRAFGRLLEATLYYGETEIRTRTSAGSTPR